MGQISFFNFGFVRGATKVRRRFTIFCFLLEWSKYASGHSNTPKAGFAQQKSPKRWGPTRSSWWSFVFRFIALRWFWVFRPRRGCLPSNCISWAPPWWIWVSLSALDRYGMRMEMLSVGRFGQLQLVRGMFFPVKVNLCMCFCVCFSLRLCNSFLWNDGIFGIYRGPVSCQAEPLVLDSDYDPI